jgi:hypothetical protein
MVEHNNSSSRQRDGDEVGAVSQEFIRATVHLSGAVPIETGHRAQYSAEHLQVRIGSVLLYFLDFAAVADFAATVAHAARIADGLFGHDAPVLLPQQLQHPGQESSLVIRLRGAQAVAAPTAVHAALSPHGSSFLTCQVGGLVLVLHSPQALTRLVRVTDSAHRLAAALWAEQVTAIRRADTGERDPYAEQWEREQVHGRR